MNYEEFKEDDDTRIDVIKALCPRGLCYSEEGVLLEFKEAIAASKELLELRELSKKRWWQSEIVGLQNKLDEAVQRADSWRAKYEKILENIGAKK